MPRSLAKAVLILSLTLAACSSSTDTRRPRGERERDSVLGASRLPGAAGVRGALRAQDSGAARNTRLDSIGQP